MSTVTARFHGEAAAIRPGSLPAWLLACRPKTLTAAAAPVLVGTAVAVREGGMKPGPAMAALLGALFLQVGANLVNDLSDGLRGTDGDDRLGPPRALQSGWLTAGALKTGIFTAFALATLCGMYLLQAGGWPVVWIGVASIVAGIAYTAGPYPLGYHGLGDLFVFAFFGPVAVMGTTFVQTGNWSMLGLICSVPIGLVSAAILMVNNLRDAEGDHRSGKNTVVVSRGGRFARRMYAMELLIPLAAGTALVFTEKSLWLLLVWAAALPACRLVYDVWTSENPRLLNPVLERTAKYLFLYAALLSAGLVL